MFHPNPVILISYLVDEMVSTEVRLDRMLQGGKEVKRAVNKYRKLLVEAQAMKDKYTLGHYRTKMEYMVAIGHKVVRINEELRGTVEVATAENEVPEDPVEAEVIQHPDRSRLLALGFPGRSFVDPTTPSRARQIGVTARVQQRAESEVESMRKMKCVACAKKFRDGLKRKSTVVKCTSCSQLTHLRCAKNAPTPFYCCKCPNLRVEGEAEVEDAPLPLVRLPSLTGAPPLPLFNSTQVLDFGLEVEGLEVEGGEVEGGEVEGGEVERQPVTPVPKKRKTTIVDLSRRITRRRVLSLID